MTGVPPVVWVVAARATAERWVGALREAGYAAGALAWAEAAALPFGGAYAAEADLVLFTSRQAAVFLPEDAGAGRPAACVGQGTADAARARSYDVVLVGSAGGADIAARILTERPEAKRVLFLCGREARHEAPDALAAGGVSVESVPIYATEPLPGFADRVAAAPEPGAVILGSPRAVEALARALEESERTLPDGAGVLALGAVTAERASACFGRYVQRASSTDADGLVRAVRAALAGQEA